MLNTSHHTTVDPGTFWLTLEIPETATYHPLNHAPPALIGTYSRENSGRNEDDFSCLTSHPILL